MKNIFLTTTLIFFACLFAEAQLPYPVDTLYLDSTVLEVRVVAKNRYIPWDLAWSPKGWLWFSQRNGKVMRMRPENGYIEEVFEISDSFESFENSGLHALALHPEFPEVPYIYVHFTFTWDSSRIVRYTFDEENITLKDRFVIENGIWGSSSHNGSRIVFSPDGSKIFVAIGDGYQAERAQDVDDLNGSILRYNADGSIPEDNPFPGSPVWSYGHRNPQGLVFGPNGILYSSEHGTANHDEINIIEKGRNYGWPNVEGWCDTPPEEFVCNRDSIKAPLYDWTWTVAACGMDFYDHPSIPEWQNSLLQATLKSGPGNSGQRLQIFHLDEPGTKVNWIEEHFAKTFGRLRDVMATPDGRIFFCTSNREVNGEEVIQPEDDKILEIRNLNLDYEVIPFEGDVLDALRIGPNPASGSLNIRLPFYQGIAKMSLIDLRGTQVWSGEVNFNGQTEILNMANIGPGLYAFEIELNDGRVAVRKLFFN
ncbi:MAG: PQQ-dependent sugar dehydrogenase [Bacteroidia bacterium]|nr:PQQ-dependent sugar dehydrogenase [Bacteroidia bacterium]